MTGHRSRIGGLLGDTRTTESLPVQVTVGSDLQRITIA